MRSGLPALTVLHHERDIKTYQGADVGRPQPVGPDNLHRLPFTGERDHYLVNARIAAPCIGVYIAEQSDLILERRRGQRIRL